MLQRPKKETLFSYVYFSNALVLHAQRPKSVYVCVEPKKPVAKNDAISL